ncbi:MAG: hypothetical protein ACLQHT_22095 [Terracidiphilus sp.]|jgi:glycosyltransferase involved in cell wall biosynthesis
MPCEIINNRCKSARAIVTRCEFHRQRFINLGLPAEKIYVNFGGVDVPAQPPQHGPDACKRFLTIAYLVPKKGPIYLLEAFCLAAASGHDRKFGFLKQISKEWRTTPDLTSNFEIRRFTNTGSTHC